MTNEIDLIRELVGELGRIVRETEYDFHSLDTVPWPQKIVYSGELRCPCVLCDARQYLEWREPPKVEDPASDQLDLEEAIAKAVMP